jgi:hypothetical protein
VTVRIDLASKRVALARAMTAIEEVSHVPQLLFFLLPMVALLNTFSHSISFLCQPNRFATSGKGNDDNGKDKFDKGDNNKRRSEDSRPPTAFLHAACGCPFEQLFLTLSLSFIDPTGLR